MKRQFYRSPEFQAIIKMSAAEAKTVCDAAVKWRIRDAGIGLYAWEEFRQTVGHLSVREKLRPTHWQRDLEHFFIGHMVVADLPEDWALARRVITALMNESRSWCNPEIGVDDPAARVALRKAFDQILAAQVSTPLDDAGQASQPVDVIARTAELARELGI